MNKFTIAAIIAILAGFGGLVIWTNLNQDEEVIDYSPLNAKEIQVPHELNGQIGEHIRGKKDSKVVVLEYADMMCAGCAGSTKTADRVYEEYGDRVAFVFRHFPISGHANSLSAAAAVESAAMQGYFWEMIDAIYGYRDLWLQANGTARTEAYMEVFKIAAPQGNVEEFKKHLGDKVIEQKIKSDRALGDQMEVSATPSFYVNGHLIDFEKENIVTQEDVYNLLVRLINKALAGELEPVEEAKKDENQNTVQNEDTAETKEATSSK